MAVRTSMAPPRGVAAFARKQRAAARCRRPTGRTLSIQRAPPSRPTPGPPNSPVPWPSQHARVREFLQAQRDRWRQIAAHFTRQIETLQAEVHTLRAAQRRPVESGAPGTPGQTEVAGDASRRYPMAADEIRDLKVRNAELQRQLLEARAASALQGAAATAESGTDLAAQKRRLLAELESDDQHDAESADRRPKIEEIVARTDKIVAEKDREIEELHYLLTSQSNSLGSLALGAAALEQVLDQDEIVREERQRLQQSHDECREKFRQAEIELAMERARLARRDAEIEEQLPQRRTAAGRPRRGRSPAPPAVRFAAAGGRRWA